MSFPYRHLLLGKSAEAPPRPPFFFRLKQNLDFNHRKVGAIQAQARRLTAIAARSGLPVEVSREKLAAVQAEAMEVHDRRRYRRLSDLAEAEG